MSGRNEWAYHAPGLKASVVDRRLVISANEEEEMGQLVADAVEIILASWRPEGRAEGREKGLAEGRLEGQIEAKRALTMRLMELRFGSPTPDLRARIEATDSLSELDDLFVRSMTCNPLDSFLS